MAQENLSKNEIIHDYKFFEIDGYYSFTITFIGFGKVKIECWMSSLLGRMITMEVDALLFSCCRHKVMLDAATRVLNHWKEKPHVKEHTFKVEEKGPEFPSYELGIPHDFFNLQAYLRQDSVVGPRQRVGQSYRNFLRRTLRLVARGFFKAGEAMEEISHRILETG